MLSAAKHLCAHPDRPFAPLRVTTPDRSCLLKIIIGTYEMAGFGRYSSLSAVGAINRVHDKVEYLLNADIITSTESADKSAICTVNRHLRNALLCSLKFIIFLGRGKSGALSITPLLPSHLTHYI